MNQKRFLKQPYWHLVQKGALRRADCFHVTSEAEAEDVRRLGFSAPIALLPNGVDLPHTLSGGESRTILFLGRIARIKGLDLLLPAWKRIAEDFPDWRLDVVGPVDRDYEREFRARLEAARLPRLRMTGPLHGEDKARAFSEAALVVLPSYSENFGMVVAEALAHGVPVITTTATPWQGLDRNGCGWCVTPDEHAVENAIRAALQLSSGERREMGRRGRAWIEREFCWDSIAEQMGSVYTWLLGGGRRPECVRESG